MTARPTANPEPRQTGKRALIKRRMARRVEAIILLVLLIIALAHLLRLVTGAELLVDGMRIPLWASFFGCIGPAVLAGLFWWSRR